MVKRVCSIVFVVVAACSISLAADKYALLIGVSRYQNAHFNSTPLEYPEADASEVSELLKESGYQVRVLTGKQATAASINSELLTLEKRGTQDGVVLIGLFGHGVQFGDEAYFCPFDAGVRRSTDAQGKPAFNGNGQPLLEPDAKTLISMRQLLEALTLTGASNRVLLADCCRNDPRLARGGPLTGRAFGSNLNASDLPEGTAAIFSCSNAEQSFEHDDWKHGAFTKAFLDYFRSLKPDSDSTVNSMSKPLARSVQALVSSKHPKEIQQVNPINNGIVDLMIVLKPMKSSVEITDKKMDSVEVPPIPQQASMLEVEMSDSAGDWFTASLNSASIGDVPAGWDCPISTFAVTESAGRRSLSYSGTDLAFVSFRAAFIEFLSNDFVIELDVTLVDAAMELTLQNGAETRRLRIFEDRGWHIAGTSVPPGAQLVARDRPSTIRLERRGEKIKIFTADLAHDGTMVFAKQFAWDGGITALRLGLASGIPKRNAPMSLTGMRLAIGASAAIGKAEPKTFLDASFLNTAKGDSPEGWTPIPEHCVGVNSLGGQPFLTKFIKSDAGVTLADEWGLEMINDYFLELDFSVSGGGSHNGSCELEAVFLSGRRSAKLKFSTYRGSLFVGDTSGPPDKKFFDWMPAGSFATVQIQRRAGLFKAGFLPLTGDGPDVFVQTEADKAKIAKFALNFLGGEDAGTSARVFGIRAQRLQE